VETATIYELTELGYSLDEPLVMLHGWAELHWPDVEEARREWDLRSTPRRSR
jgi:DNA-binding HxlR family transcriptional regulator